MIVSFITIVTIIVINIWVGGPLLGSAQLRRQEEAGLKGGVSGSRCLGST